jgi:CheY-like chemotaxis protein
MVANEYRTERSFAQLRVLVVDDNKDAADTLTALLESLGQQVHGVYDGASAVAAAKTFNPDLVLLDIGMPQMSGYEVARALQAADPAVKPVLVAITGWDKTRTRSGRPRPGSSITSSSR